MTRPTDRADQLADTLEGLGADVHRLPAIALAPVKLNGAFTQALKQMEHVQCVNLS